MIKIITCYTQIALALAQGNAVYDANLSYQVRQQDGQFYIVNPNIQYCVEMLNIEKHSLFTLGE